MPFPLDPGVEVANISLKTHRIRVAGRMWDLQILTVLSGSQLAPIPA